MERRDWSDSFVYVTKFISDTFMNSMTPKDFPGEIVPRSCLYIATPAPTYIYTKCILLLNEGLWHWCAIQLAIRVRMGQTLKDTQFTHGVVNMKTNGIFQLR